MKYDLHFLIMVDIRLPYDEFITAVKEMFPKRHSDKHRSFFSDGNFIELRRNDDYDPDFSRSHEDGFMDMRYRVEASPDANRTEEDQIALATRMIRHIRSKGGTTVGCANYEDKLEV